MKLIAALLLCVAMTSHAANFAGLAAMNESGITTTQTAGIAGTDVPVFYIPVPTMPGQTYGHRRGPVGAGHGTHQLWVDSTDSNGDFGCDAPECDMRVRIELFQTGKMAAHPMA